MMILLADLNLIQQETTSLAQSPDWRRFELDFISKNGILKNACFEVRGG